MNIQLLTWRMISTILIKMDTRNRLYKHPRTPHLSFTGYKTDEDLVIDPNHLYKQSVVITKKMDGENTTLYPNYFHARSLDAPAHPSQDYVKALHAQIKHLMWDNLRICGENLYAKHSIYYEDLKSYFLVHSVWEEDVCLSWGNTEIVCEMLGLHTVPVIGDYDKIDEKIIKDIISNLDTDHDEGIVIRNRYCFLYKDFDLNVAKWVRPNHVTSDSHWKHNKIILNKLCVS